MSAEGGQCQGGAPRAAQGCEQCAVTGDWGGRAEDAGDGRDWGWSEQPSLDELFG